MPKSPIQDPDVIKTTLTATPTESYTVNPTVTATPTVTKTPTESYTVTPTVTATPTVTTTPTGSNTVTSTMTETSSSALSSLASKKSSSSLRAKPELNLNSENFPLEVSLLAPASPMPVSEVTPAHSEAFDQVVAEAEQQVQEALDQADKVIKSAHKLLIPDFREKARKSSITAIKTAEMLDKYSSDRLDKRFNDVFTDLLMTASEELYQASEFAYEAFKVSNVTDARKAITQVQEKVASSEELLQRVVQHTQLLEDAREKEHKVISERADRQLKAREEAEAKQVEQDNLDRLVRVEQADRAQKLALKQASRKRLIKGLLIAAGAVAGLSLVATGGLTATYFATGLTPVAILGVSRDFVFNKAWPAVSNFAMNLLAKAAYFAQVAAVKVVTAVQDFASVARSIALVVIARLSEVATNISSVASNVASAAVEVGTNISASVWNNISSFATTAVSTGSSLLSRLTASVSNMSLYAKVAAGTGAAVTGLAALVGGVFAYNKVKVDRRKPKSLDDLALFGYEFDADSSLDDGGVIPSPALITPLAASFTNNPYIVSAPSGTARQAAQDAAWIAQLAVNPEAFAVRSEESVAATKPSCCKV